MSGNEPGEKMSLIDFLHPGCILVISLERWHVVVAGGNLFHDVSFDIFVETETELDHAVNAAGVDLGILEAEARSEKRGFVEKHDKILDGFVILIGIGLLAQRLHDRVLGVYFHLQAEEGRKEGKKERRKEGKKERREEGKKERRKKGKKEIMVLCLINHFHMADK